MVDVDAKLTTSTEEVSLREREDRERSAARSRQRLAEEVEDRRLVKSRGGPIYMTQKEAADHVAERLSLLQRWRGGDALAGQQLSIQERSRLFGPFCSQGTACERRRAEKKQRAEEKRLARMKFMRAPKQEPQGMPSISESTMEEQQQQQQVENHVRYIGFIRGSGLLGAPVPILGVTKRGALLTAQGGSCAPSGEGRVWVFCDAFGNARDERAPEQHVNLEELSTRAFSLHQGVRGGSVLPALLWRTEDHATSGASFLTQERAANDVNDGTASEAPSDSSYFTTRWLPHDLV